MNNWVVVCVLCESCGVDPVVYGPFTTNLDAQDFLDKELEEKGGLCVKYFVTKLLE